jgi:hypothetical protein
MPRMVPLSMARRTVAGHHGVAGTAQDWLGPTSDVSVISGKVLSAYHADLV